MSRKVLTLLFTLTALGLHGQTTLFLARNEELAEQAVAESLIKAIYGTIDFTAEVEPLPPARANAMAVGGQKDGEVARIESYGVRNPSLVRVEPSYYSLTTAAFSLQSRNIVIRSKSDLLKYRVGIIRGVQHSADATAGHPDVELASSAETLFQMLRAGRFDVALDTGINGAYMIKKMALSNVREVGVLAKLPLFNYLHERNRDKAAVIGQAIIRLQESGELLRMIRRAEQNFLVGSLAP